MTSNIKCLKVLVPIPFSFPLSLTPRMLIKGVLKLCWIAEKIRINPHTDDIVAHKSLGIIDLEL